MGLLAYDGCLASEIFSIVDTLALANKVAPFHGAVTRINAAIHAVRPGPIRTSSGTTIAAAPMTYSLDLLIVPGFDLDPSQDPMAWLTAWRSEVAAIQRAARRSVRLASVCVGAFLLADSGVLDEHRATTAWLFADALADAFPRVDVDRKALLVEDGAITTTGAFGASVDLALHLVAAHAGPEVARATSRITLAASRHSQSPFIDESMVAVQSGSLSAKVRRYLNDHLGESYDLGELAAVHRVSTRTLLRRFRNETGESPLAYLQSIRTARARRLLETSDLSVEAVARQVGNHDTSTFRRQFQRNVGMPPGEYRRAFQKR